MRRPPDLTTVEMHAVVPIWFVEHKDARRLLGSRLLVYGGRAPGWAVLLVDAFWHLVVATPRGIEPLGEEAYADSCGPNLRTVSKRGLSELKSTVTLQTVFSRTFELLIDTLIDVKKRDGDEHVIMHAGAILAALHLGGPGAVRSYLRKLIERRDASHALNGHHVLRTPSGGQNGKPAEARKLARSSERKRRAATHDVRAPHRPASRS